MDRHLNAGELYVRDADDETRRQFEEQLRWAEEAARRSRLRLAEDMARHQHWALAMMRQTGASLMIVQPASPPRPPWWRRALAAIRRMT